MELPVTFESMSYSREDADWLKRLQTTLAPLVQDQTIRLWDDAQIKPGTKWKAKIEEPLAKARMDQWGHLNRNLRF
jgi:hypothetical protein